MYANSPSYKLMPTTNYSTYNLSPEDLPAEHHSLFLSAVNSRLTLHLLLPFSQVSEELIT